jgi:hypothetical protein
MKRILSLLAFLIVLSSAASSQSTGNGNSGNGNPWGNGNWSELIVLLENGGQVPTPIVNQVLHAVKDWGRQTFGLSLGQMHQKYGNGELAIVYLSTSPPSLTFRVSYGGVLITSVIDVL